MARIGRIVAVTAALSVVGAVFGAIAGVVALFLSLLVTGSGDLGGATSTVVLYAALIGGALGALGAPAAAWLLLRHVPIGRAIFWSGLGATVGGVGGLLATVWLQAGDEIRNAVLGAIAGFLAAALVLRLRAPRQARSGSSRNEP
ncbi:MAG TPA: hypothetical protein VFU01_02820 [Gemmatimonadaceae bacterium]|nr:hypothetical protein [Gemmatimonadaceae bacterium]